MLDVIFFESLVVAQYGSRFATEVSKKEETEGSDAETRSHSRDGIAQIKT